MSQQLSILSKMVIWKRDRNEPDDFYFKMSLSVLIGLPILFFLWRYLSNWLRKRKRRISILSEILTTERTYVNQLRTLDTYYIQPLNDPNQRVLPMDKIRRIFPQALSVILKTNEILLEKLEKRLKVIKFSSSIGDIFIEIGPFLKSYSSYINSMEESREELKNSTQPSLLGASPFRKFVRKTQKNNIFS